MGPPGTGDALIAVQDEDIGVEHGRFTAVVFLGGVPAGSYVAHGIVTGDLMGAGMQCDLELSSLEDLSGARQHFGISGDHGQFTMPLMVAATLGATGRAIIACTSFGSDPLPRVKWAAITLVPVTSITRVDV